MYRRARNYEDLRKEMRFGDMDFDGYGVSRSVWQRIDGANYQLVNTILPEH